MAIAARIDVRHGRAGMGSVPFRPEEITAEWLSDAIGSKVTHFDLEQIGIGVGLLGRLYRVTVRSDGGPSSVVAKFPALDEGARMNVAEPLRFYEKEVRFYQEAADQTPVSTPKVYAAEHDQASGDFVLLLEDLCDRRMEDQITGCHTDDARTALDALISLHSHWWGKELPAWLPTYSDPPYPQVIAGMYKNSWPRAQEIFEGHIPAEILEFGERYVDIVPWFMDELGGEPWTYCHGDFRLDNLFFATDASHAPVTVVDWQIGFKGRGGYDVAYFVSQSLTTDTRRECERSIKQSYLEGLEANGIDYDPELLDTDYRRTVAYCFIYPVVASAQFELANERQRDLLLGMADRAVKAIEDTNALDILPS
jgi:hypothetical protein